MSDEPMLTPEEEAELVERANGSYYLQPMTLIEEAEAMAVRLEAMADTERDALEMDYWHEDDLREAAAILRRMIEQMRGEGV